jgi:CheY-like chemotaxis protein
LVLKNKGISLELKLAPTGQAIAAGDRDQILQVIQNLVDNAVKYTPPAGEIRLDVRRIEEQVAVSISDNGIGIAPELQERVFDLFTRARSEDGIKTSGLGIGLSLARQLVSMHGGRIEVASAGLGKGSRFTVRLPGASISQPAAVASDVVRNGAGAPNKRILLADDNRDAAESLAIILRLEGHEVELAHDGHSAMQAFALRRPDVALLDIGMPKSNGYEVARQIRATADGHTVLLIAITGWAQDADKVQSRAAGFDHHLTKPIEPETLIGLLGVR